MFHRIAFAALLFGYLADSAIAQNDTPKPTSGLIWESVAKVEANRRTDRAKIDGGWLYMVQVTNGVALTFVPDMGVVSKNKKDKKPKKADKGAAATDLEAAKREAQAQRDQAEKARLVAEESRKEAELARRQALAEKARADEEAAKAKAQAAKLQAEVDLARKEAARLKALLEKSK